MKVEQMGCWGVKSEETSSQMQTLSHSISAKLIPKSLYLSISLYNIIPETKKLPMERHMQ
jgi:hypothetical protein